MLRLAAAEGLWGDAAANQRMQCLGRTIDAASQGWDEPSRQQAQGAARSIENRICL